jgi:hypothetical protein
MLILTPLLLAQAQRGISGRRCYTSPALERQLAHAISVFSFILRLLAIVVCGGAGGVLAWWLVLSLGWTGVGGAIAAAFLGMVLATLLWAGGIALVNAFQRRN